MKEVRAMRKLIIPMILLGCLFLGACSNLFARQEYDSDEKIAQKEDHYAKESSVFHSIDEGYSFTVSKFNGRETLWSKTLKEDQDMEIALSLHILEGQIKLVHIDREDTVTTVIECSPETSPEEFVTKTVALKSGLNRFKIVGYDCEEVDLKLLFTEPE